MEVPRGLPLHYLLCPALLSFRGLTRSGFYMQAPRACEDYWSEFSHCRSLMNRFHHYYTFGESPSCQQWKEDYTNCKQWENSKDSRAKEALQTSERRRVAEQQRFTPVWELRKEPPRDWHLPLNQDKPQDM